jgi:hypothetical protein
LFSGFVQFLSLTSVTAARQCRLDNATKGLLTVGTLDQLYAAADEHVLLALSLPLGASGLVDIPRLWYVILLSCRHDTNGPSLSDLSSDRWAWLQTNGAAGFRRGVHPGDDTIWSTAGSKGATSWIHLDDAGFCTSTQVLTGRKYYVIFDRDPGLPRHDVRGDMSSTGWAPPFADFFDHKLPGFFKAEAVELGPRTVM